MGKIGDLWVRLGLKKDDYTKGLKEAAREGESFGKGVAALGSKAKIAFAAVAAAVTGVIAAVKDLAKQNQVLGDAWNRMSAGMAASWDTFKTAVASMDFSHLLSNMREASRLAKELYNAQDALGEITTAYNIELARQSEKINKLREDLANPNLSKEERLDKGQQLLDIYTNLEKNPTRGLERAAGKSLEVIAQKLGYQMKGASEAALKATRTEVENFFVWLGSEAGEAWNQAYAAAAKDPAMLLQTNINAQNAGLSDNYRAMLYNYQTKIGEKDRLAMEQAVVAYYQQQALLSGETLRIRKQMNTIAHEGEQGPGGADTGKVITEEQRLLDFLAKEEDALEALAQESEQMRAIEADNIRQVEKDIAAGIPRQQSLSEAFGADVAAVMERNLQGAINVGEALNSWSIDGMLEQQIWDLTASLQAAQKQSEDLARSITENLVSALENGLVGAFEALAEVMGGVTEGGMEQVARALIEPLADMAIKAGTLIMMSGTAIEALKESLIGFFGGNAVLAGGALVMIGMAAKAGLASIGNKGGGSVSSVSSNTTPVSAPSNVQTAELVVHVEGHVKGSDIILSGNNTLKSWGR